MSLSAKAKKEKILPMIARQKELEKMVGVKENEIISLRHDIRMIKEAVNRILVG